MKKVLLLPLFAAMALVSQAWAGACTHQGGGACQFDTGCYEMTSEYSGVDGTCAAGSCTCNQVIDNCLANGAVYSGVTGWAEANNYGKDWKCSEHGGTYIAGKLDPTKTVLGCCKWETETNCYPIWSGMDTDGEDGATKVSACSGGSNTFWSGSGACPTSCPTTPPTYNGQNPADGYCCWEANEYNDYNGYCGPIGGETTAAKCTTDNGTIVTSCGSCNTSGSNPIIISGRSVGLTVVPSRNVLHIISEKGAKVELFSMTGAKVFSSKVAAGNSSVSLEKQRQGVYYAVITSGSQKQTVKVILK